MWLPEHHINVWLSTTPQICNQEHGEKWSNSCSHPLSPSTCRIDYFRLWHYYTQPNIHYEQEEMCCICTLHHHRNRNLNFAQKDNVHTTRDTLPWSLQTNPLHLLLQCLHDLVSQWPILDSLPYLSLRTETCYELSAGCNARITRKRCEFILYREMEQL